MTRNPLKNMLSRLIHDPKVNREDYELTYVSRGHVEDRETINCSSLVRVTHDYLIFKARDGNLKSIPFHRVISLVDKRRGKTLYFNPRLDSARP